MLDRISSEPFGFASALLIWLPLGVWVVSLVHWMIQDEIDVLVGIIGIGVAVGLMVLNASPPDKRLPLVIFVCVMTTIIFFPLVRQILLRRSLASIDAEIVERAYKLLREKPGNVGSEVKIAGVLFDRGLPGHAIAIVERIVANMPRGVMQEEQRMLAKWRMRTPQKYLEQTVPCLQCGLSNQPGPVYCSRCGAPFLLAYLQGKWVTGGLSGRLALAWMATVAAVVGFALAGMKLPTNVAPVVMGGITVGLVVVFWFTLRRQSVS